MKYRIRIENYNNGIQKFYPQVQFWGLFWGNIAYGCDTYWMFDQTMSFRTSREDALESIDIYHNQRNHIKSITFEYINK